MVRNADAEQQQRWALELAEEVWDGREWRGSEKCLIR
jgi:hypothetical protein